MARNRFWGSVLLGSVGVGVLAACGSGDVGNQFDPLGNGGTPDGGVVLGNGDGSGSGGGGGGALPYDNSKPYSDFPASTVLDTRAGSAAPAGLDAMFASSPAPSTAQPCVFEPESNVRYPRNWIAPQVGFTVADPQSNVLEVRVKAENQLNDLVFVSSMPRGTGNRYWVMPDELWEKLRTHSYDKALSISIRTAQLADGGNALTSVSQPYVIETGILPASADGSVVYFSTPPSGATYEASLRGFSTGTEGYPPTSVESFGVLKGEDVEQRSGRANCVGCHSETPDANYVMVGTKQESGAYPAEEYSQAVARVNAQGGASFGSKPSYVSAAATQALARQRIGSTATSPAFWSDSESEHLVLGWLVDEGGAYPGSRKLRTVNLDNGDVKELPTGGAPQGGMPVWSKDGSTVYYTAIKGVIDGRLGGSSPSENAADVYALPFNNGAGGTAVPVPGASSPTENEYYPAISPDGRLLSFTHAPYEGGQAPGIQGNVHANVRVIPAGGGTAVSLEANNAAQCGAGAARTVVSDGLANRWSQWSPTPKTLPDGSTAYFLTFSSGRRKNWDNPNGHWETQLYVTPIVVSPSGQITTYGALYIRSQDPTRGNHTPVWTSAKIENNSAVTVQ